jgi:hypothetical protein
MVSIHIHRMFSWSRRCTQFKIIFPTHQLFCHLMLSDWVSFLAYPNLFGIKGFVVVVVVVVMLYVLHEGNLHFYKIHMQFLTVQKVPERRNFYPERTL